MNKNLNLLIIFSIIINIVISVIFADENNSEGLLIILLSINAISIVGVILVLMNKLKWGYILIITGCIGFVPIGLIGIFGVIKAKKSVEAQQFEEKRKAQA